MFFDTWSQLLNILITGTVTYVALLLFLRISGKRTLSKWNMFDFTVTIAFGSVLASVILSKDVKIIEGVAALLLLIILQYIITKLSVKFDWFSSLIKADPSILFENGEYNHQAMRNERVPKAEILAAIREQGISSTKQVEAVVLETDGSFSVIQNSEGSSRNTLADIDEKYKDK